MLMSIIYLGSFILNFLSDLQILFTLAVSVLGGWQFVSKGVLDRSTEGIKPVVIDWMLANACHTRGFQFYCIFIVVIVLFII